MKAQVKPAIATLLSEKTRNQLSYSLLVVVVVGLVFHAPLITWFDLHYRPSAIIRSWKEILVVVVMVLLLPNMIARKLYNDRLVRLIILFSIILITVSFFRYRGLSTLVGLRTNLFPLLLFIIGLSLPTKKYLKLRRIILYLGIFVAISIIAQYFLPPEWFIYSIVGAAEKAGNLTIQESATSRLYGVLSGPLQASSYLVLITALVLNKKKLAYKDIVNKRSVLVFLLLFVAIFLTYSRAALGGFVLVIATLIYTIKPFSLKKTLLPVIVAIMLLGFLALRWEPLSLLVFHAPPDKALSASSTSDHVIYPYKASKLALQNPLGLGAGAAGPASFFSDKPMVTENYYIQLALEAGLVGMIVFLLILFHLARRLYSIKYFQLLAALIGLSAMSLLLNTWADTITAWTFWLLAGLSLAQAPLYKSPESAWQSSSS